MGIAIPQVITSDRASGAQVIDGSLKFNEDNKTVLERTNTRSAANAAASVSVWVKRSTLSSSALYTLLQYESGGTFAFGLTFYNDYMYAYDNTTQDADAARSDGLLRDVNSWYHIFYSRSNGEADGTLYINGVEQSKKNSVNTLTDWFAYEGQIGYRKNGTQRYYDGFMSQLYVIDGQQLSPNDFGFTDPLTNTWRPKKYEGTFGTTGFYLPMDGNSPIGQDKSGNGNDWTPVNFGGSVALDNPQVSGARPILNTTQGGTQAGVGVFGSNQNVGYAVTVYNDGGGNKYYIDGVKQATLTGLIRGATYTFDTSDSTVSSHPFRFSATSNGSHGGGSEYTNGVAAITGAATTITIPYNAPNELYYYCTSHSGMGSSITGITTNEKLADQYASNCVLALPLVGANSDASASIACTMTNKAVTSNGNAAASSDTSNFYSGSFEFDGYVDYLQATVNTDGDFGTGEFTVEFWINRTGDGTGGAATDYESLIGSNASGATGWNAYIRRSTKKIVWHDGSTRESTGDSTIQNGKWHHIAHCRDSNSDLRSFIDGVKVLEVGNVTTSTDTNGNDVFIGRDNGAANRDFYGYISDIRIYKGVAKYTSDFVVPSRSPDILPDTPSGVSGGSKLTKITDGAVAFDGSGDYLNISGTNSEFAFGTGDFTVEFFINTSNWNVVPYDSRPQTLNGDYLTLYIDSNGALRWDEGGTNRIQGSNGEITKNAWVHIAATREGTSAKLFVNGSQTGSTYTDSTDYLNATNRPFIGAQSRTVGNSAVNGFISNLRVIKGTALYTSRFTPPTRELTNVTNTKLLCCQSNTSATEAAVTPGSITANGDAAATNFNPFNTDINTVRGQETGYCTLNPLAKANISLSDGNLALTHSGTTGNWQLVLSTIGMSSGKFYCEFLCQDADSVIGIAKGNHVIANDKYVGQDPGGYSYNGQNGQKLNNSSGSSYGSSYAAGDLIGIAFDGDNGTLRFYKNNVDQGEAFSSLTDEYFFAFSIRDTGYTHTVNFGQKPFKFPPPDGFQPLNAANVRPETVISRPDQYVGIVTYASDGKHTLSVVSTSNLI